MRVIPPLTIDETVLMSSTVLEPDPGIDPPIWTSTTTYVDGSRATVLSTHKVYESVGGSTGGFSPEISVAKAVPKWIEVGFTNRWTMFDLYRSTPTITSTAETTIILKTNLPDEAAIGVEGSFAIADTVISPSLPAGVCYEQQIQQTPPNALALLNMRNVASVRIKATTVADNIVKYDKTYSLTGRATTSWYTYFFGGFPFLDTNSIVIFDLPTTSGELYIEITFTGQMTIGTLALGTSEYIGQIQRGSSVDVQNFSTIERDIFGTAYIVPRRNIPKTNQRVYIDKSRLAELLALKKRLDAIPVVWVGVDEPDDPYYFANLIVGFYKEFSFSIDNPIGPTIILEVEEI